MTSLSENYSLPLYNSTTDASERLINFVDDIAGVSSFSAMNLIDSIMADLQSQLDIISDREGIIPVPATYISPNYYEATVADITAYDTNLIISLSLDTDSNGSVTLNINSLGTKTLKKIDSAGSYADISGGDIQSNRENLFRYNGTYWVWIGAIAGDQLHIDGTAGNFVKISSTNGLEDASVSDSTYGRRFTGKTTAPTTTDDSGAGYRVGDVWVDETGDKSYIAVDVSSSAAIWNYLTRKVALTNIQVYTSSDTWSKPSDIHHVVVEVVGAGGGGGGTESSGTGTASTGAPGAGGGYSMKLIQEASLGATETVTIGAGGSAGMGGAGTGTPGGIGGTSSFGSHCSASGGSGGLCQDPVSSLSAAGQISGGTLPGIGSNGDINIRGCVGFPSTLITSGLLQPNIQGRSKLSSLGRLSSPNGDVDGLDGLDYGAGGSGGQQTNAASSSYYGGAGGGGLVIVYEYTYVY